MTAAKVRAIYTEEFRFRRPKGGTSFWIKPSDEPQYFPRDVTEAAIAAGAAKEAPRAKKGKTGTAATTGTAAKTGTKPKT